MFSPRFLARYGFVPALLGLAMMLAGCRSKMDQAIEQAKQQANQTGQPQQVIAVDKQGVTTTAVVQPRANGQAAQTVTTTTTPPPSGGPVPAAQDPKISAVNAAPAQIPAPEQPTAADASAAPAAGPATSRAAAPAAAAPAPQPVTIPAGTSLAVRINREIDVKSAQAGDSFTAEVVEPVKSASGKTIIPKGTPAAGVIDVAQKRGNFKGASDLQLRLTSITLNGARYSLKTKDLAEHKKGKGKRSTAMIGGGAGLGLLIGGLAGGGKGAAIGGLAGAGAGTAAAGMTGNRDLAIAAGTVLHFKIAQSLTIQNE